MITRMEVFAKRKEGIVDEAYRMALQLMGSPNADDWDRKAFCWCLIDIIKRDAENGNNENLAHYQKQLESVEAAPSDEILAKGIRHALSLCNPNSGEYRRAKAMGKEGRHAEAAAAYRTALAACPANREVQTGFGWELFKHTKELMAVENVMLGAVKRNLNDYLKLDVEKPSLLHSCVLQLAAKLAGKDGFNMLIFSRLWNLDNLRPEDFVRFRAEDGKEYPSLAEKVIQQVGKEAAASGNAREQEHVLPRLDAAIERFPDNVWFKLDKAKVLLSLGMHAEALAFGLAVAKAKSNDYWAWGLLGDIVSRTDGEVALGCYCKALSCPADDKFTGKIRLKVARRMLESNNLSAAKLEVETVTRSKKNEGHKIPEDAAEIASQPWFSETAAASSNRDFYRSKLHAAEALLFGSLPWIHACVGEKYFVSGNNDKPKRWIFLESSCVPTKASISESKLGRRKPELGEAIRVKGEFDANQRFKVFVLESREAKSQWDVFPESIGIVYHVNHEKGVLHFIVNREIDGVIPLSELGDSFSEGDSIALRLSNNGPPHRVLLANASDKQPGPDIRKFSENVRVSNDMGFTESGVFVSPSLVSRHRLQDGRRISGTAVLSFNKKKSNWGWKAISIAND
jgi:tetratricopeptide (TPR) repeat protein